MDHGVVDRGAEMTGDVAQWGETQNLASSRYRLVSNTRHDGSDEFDKGLNLLRSRSPNDALAAFDSASAAEPENAMYRYYRALALFNLNDVEAARDALQQAIDLERERPIESWGKRMERVQGQGRVWIESARRAAGVTR